MNFKWNPLKRVAAALLVLAFTLSITTPVFAATDDTTDSIDSKSIKLSEISGDITIEKGTKVLPTKRDMRLFDGWTITTGEDSYAFLELDDSKFIKADQYTKIKITKTKKTNNISVISGAIFVNVTSPLASDENMTVRTTCLTMGVRGTSFAVQQNNDTTPYTSSTAQLYSGVLEFQDSSTGNSGEMLAGNQYEQKNNQRSGFSEGEMTTLNSNGSNILPVALSEIVTDSELLEEILEYGWLFPDTDMTYEEILIALKDYLAEAETENKERLEQIIIEIEKGQKAAEDKLKANTPDIGNVNNYFPAIGGSPGDRLPTETVEEETKTSGSSGGNESGGSNTLQPLPINPNPTNPTDPADPPPTEPTGGQPVFVVDDTSYSSFEAALAALATADEPIMTMNSGSYILENMPPITYSTYALPSVIQLTVTQTAQLTLKPNNGGAGISNLIVTAYTGGTVNVLDGPASTDLSFPPLDDGTKVSVVTAGGRGTVNFMGGTISNANLKADNSGTLNINGGTFNNANVLSENAYAINIDAGTFKNAEVLSNSGSTMNISGGTFDNADIKVQDFSTVNVSGGNYVSATTLSISDNSTMNVINDIVFDSCTVTVAGEISGVKRLSGGASSGAAKVIFNTSASSADTNIGTLFYNPLGPTPELTAFSQLKNAIFTWDATNSRWGQTDTVSG